MNYQSPNLEDSRTSRKKKSGKRQADETFASLDCAGAARTRLIAEELIEQLTRAQIGDLSEHGSVERLDHLNISLQLLAPAPTAQPNLSTITATSKEAHKLVKDLEESVNGRRGQRAQRRAESSLRLAAITKSEAERLLEEDRDASVQAQPLKAQLKAELDADDVKPDRKTEKKPELKSLGSLLKRPAPTVVTKITPPLPLEQKSELQAPEAIEATVVPPGEVGEADFSQEQFEERQPVEQIALHSVMPAPPEVRSAEAQKISKANWQAAKEIAGGKESGALLLNIISEPERAVTDMIRQAKWTLKKWTE